MACFLCFVQNEDEIKLDKLIGLKLEKLRRKAGYSSQEIFSYDCGVSRSQYGLYEQGKANISIHTLLRILKFHGITFKTFFSKGFEEMNDMQLKGFEGYSRPKEKIKTKKKKALKRR